MTFEQQYLNILKKCFEGGVDKPSRGGIDQRSLFGVQMRINLKDGFPLLTTRKISFKIVAYEMLWILKAKTNIKYLQEHGVHIWDKFANEDGEVGPMYQWRNWHYAGQIIDQLKNIIREIKENPHSKRLVVSSWNAGELDQMTLPPCPHMFQFMVAGDTLHCNLTQRAGDLILGVPYDLPVYALLTHLVAQITNLKPGEVIYNIADCHIYHDHFDIVQKLFSIEPRKMPTLLLDESVKEIDEFDFHHMKIENYDPATTMTAPIAVGPLFQTFFHSDYRKVKKPKPNKNLKINNLYFTEIDWSVRKASTDIKEGLKLLATIDQPIATIFGSHNIKQDDPLYKHASELAFHLGKRGYAIMTGGGPGIMHGANSGAMHANVPSIGLRSDALINEEPGDDNVLTHKALVHFLFSRRFIMSIKSDALIFYPGAYGTITEFFEDVALMSANLVDVVPVVCVGSDYWKPLLDWFTVEIERRKFTDDSKKYTSMVRIEDDIESIIKIVTKKK